MTMFAVHYTYSESSAAGRDEHRPAHRAWLARGVDAGTVISAGAYADGTGALILIEGADTESVEGLLTEDPFVQNDLVTAIRVHEWRPVLGAFSDS